MFRLVCVVTFVSGFVRPTIRASPEPDRLVYGPFFIHTSLHSPGSVVPYKPFLFYYGTLMGTAIPVRCFSSLVQGPSSYPWRHSQALAMSFSSCPTKVYHMETVPTSTPASFYIYYTVWAQAILLVPI